MLLLLLVLLLFGTSEILLHSATHTHRHTHTNTRTHSRWKTNSAKLTKSPINISQASRGVEGGRVGGEGREGKCCCQGESKFCCGGRQLLLVYWAGGRGACPTYLRHFNAEAARFNCLNYQLYYRVTRQRCQTMRLATPPANAATALYSLLPPATRFNLKFKANYQNTPRLC